MLMPVMGLLLLSNAAWADSRYIIDELSVNMRKGMGTDYAINAILNSGDNVTVLSDDAKSGYSKVRTADGKVGYILTRFLSREAPGRIQAERMRSELETLKQKNAELQQSLESQQANMGQIESQKTQVSEERDKLQSRLDWIEEASANTVQIAEENQKLREQLLAIESEITNLRQENHEMKTLHQGQKVGAIILGIGLVIGWLFGRFRRSSGAWSSGGL